MKEIKFKAWDKKKKDFVFYPHGIQTTVMLDGSKVITIDDEDVEFLLFTGLKDKNGKEVYEGDICEYHNGRGVYVGVVKYIQEYSAFRIEFNDGTWTDLAFVEVIGNIYENPELLEQEG